ncbi:macrolide 2'-phosphotransferase [Arthrobacter russicus]|uniref:Aminoglycoside phosphotransferase (APT) family kinase protein n=1 Tax=Arthrobacter russicus TaxID=172040 RepID=A0ABU1J8F5_9MICC|nr:macrolide 2'-phosphotransferase [Arthrobacter russicus]MDR6268703.1 aminoglycoside phosphotransferase (APT) family kinase protein [Arthrobacter russicus]
MRRTPIELAAIASAAVPGLSPVAASYEPDDAVDFDSALLIDGDRKRWRVRAPKHVEASTRLETELLVLRAFTPAIRAELPFLLPTVAGTVRIGELTTFVYSHMAGRVTGLDALASGGTATAKEVGAAMAAVHDLPVGLVQQADLPSYTANEFRQRRLNELDQAATTGKIPAALLRRWEHALEDIALWRFNPCVVHGDMHEDNILFDDGRLTAITGWTDLRIGDPADDFAWLIAMADQSFADSVQESYSAARTGALDRHLLRRAALSAEFALAQWLVRGVAAGDPAMIAEAEDMLHTLEQDIAEHGGQPISVEAPVVPVSTPAVTIGSVADPTPTADSAGDAGEAEDPGTAQVPGSEPKVAVETIPDEPSDAAATGSADSGDSGHPDNTETTALKTVSHTA